MQTKQAQTTPFTDKAHTNSAKRIHILSLLNHKRAHGRADTLCAIPRLTELKQMKELVNEI